jgi:hypothetical protein
MKVTVISFRHCLNNDAVSKRHSIVRRRQSVAREQHEALFGEAQGKILLSLPPFLQIH